MTRTEYLFNQKPDRYPEQIALAERKIADAREHLKLLADKGRNMSYIDNNKKLNMLDKHYSQVERAIEFWEDILHEHKEIT